MSLRFEMVTTDCSLDLVGPGAELGADEVEDDHSALVIGDPSSSALAVEGTQGQLRAFVRRLQAAIDEAFGYRHPLMTAAIEALASVGVNAEVEAGPSPGMIELNAALPDGTVLGIFPGDDNWWPTGESATWHFTGWQVLHYDPASEHGISDPIATIEGPGNPWDSPGTLVYQQEGSTGSPAREPEFDSPQTLVELVSRYLAGNEPT
jgi:hypothetical protein